MANTSPLPTAAGSGPERDHRPRLRAVEALRGPTAPLSLPPGATWLPAPQHARPALGGQPPMEAYLVLVPADQHRTSPPAPPGPPAGRGPVRIDPDRRAAWVDERELDLTYLEFELLAHLVAHPHRVHARAHLVTTVWGYGHVGDGRTVDVHIARLRRKLGAAHRAKIQTVRRVGYRYAP
ncbi:winged helix-turn-helix domain-containing protein [Streptomyces sp. NPDC006879]|uniref:winged helix-turn-helix domain-containing protein n=1 Tax=Streptomyces sp. NPDC006879 TaxID=3364767 RepID=UPI0036CDB8DA